MANQKAASASAARPPSLAAGSKKKATFNLDADLHRRLKIVAAQHQREMVDLVEEALNVLLRRMEA